MKDLAPEIWRQRLIIEGKPLKIVDDNQIKEYLLELSNKLNMKTLIPPVTHKSDKFGWAGWIHWESSGAHFYSWENPFLFFSVDIYTCKKFDDNTAIEFTKSYFKVEEVVFRSV